MSGIYREAMDLSRFGADRVPAKSLRDFLRTRH